MAEVIIDVPSNGFEIRSLWAWLALDQDGEGILSASIGSEHMPLVASTLDTAVALRRLARHTAASTGKTVRLVRFDSRTVIEEIEPAPRH